jgi:hypothetical protein
MTLLQVAPSSTLEPAQSIRWQQAMKTKTCHSDNERPTRMLELPIGAVSASHTCSTMTAPNNLGSSSWYENQQHSRRDVRQVKATGEKPVVEPGEGESSFGDRRCAHPNHGSHPRGLQATHEDTSTKRTRTEKHSDTRSRHGTTTFASDYNKACCPTTNRAHTHLQQYMLQVTTMHLMPRTVQSQT